MKRRLIIPALVLTAGIVFAIGMIKPHTETQSSQDEIVEEAVIPEEPQPSRAEQVVKALAAAYPLRIEKAEFQNDVTIANEVGAVGVLLTAFLIFPPWNAVV